MDWLSSPTLRVWISAFLNNDRVTFHLTANVLLFKWGAFFLSFSPASFFPPSLIQSSSATLEWNMAIITFYLGWARARSYLPSVAAEWWLVAGGTLGWLAHRRQGRLLLQRENQEWNFFTSPFFHIWHNKTQIIIPLFAFSFLCTLHK